MLKIKDFFKQPIMYVLIVCIIIQMLMYSVWENYGEQNDSLSYLESYNKGSIFKGYVNQERTPVYPYFIKTIKKLGGEENLKKNIVLVQKILFLISIVLFYYALKTITKNKLILTLITLIFGIAPGLVAWNAMILTEAISVFETVLLVFFTLKYLQNSSKISAIFINIMIFIMILTRPAFIFLMPIYLLFWAIRFFTNKEEKKNIIVALISFVVVTIMLIGYCLLVKMNYGNFGLTSVSNVNNVTTAICSNGYKNSKNEKLKNRIQELAGKNPEPAKVFDVWYIVETEYSNEELKEFAKESLYNNKEYREYLVNKIINLSEKNIGTLYNFVTQKYQKETFKIYDMKIMENIVLPINFGMIYLMLLGTISYLIYYLIKHKKIDWILAFCTVFIFANLFTAIVGAPYETQRLFISAIVFVLLEIAYIMEKYKKMEN